MRAEPEKNDSPIYVDFYVIYGIDFLCISYNTTYHIQTFPPSAPPIALPPDFMHSVTHIKQYQVKCVYPEVPQHESVHWSLVGLSSIIPLKKMNSPSPNTNQMAIAPLLKLEPAAHFTSSKLGFYLTWVHMGLGHAVNIAVSSSQEVPSHLENSVSLSSSATPGSHSLFTPWSTMVLELWLARV